MSRVKLIRREGQVSHLSRRHFAFRPPLCASSALSNIFYPVFTSSTSDCSKSRTNERHTISSSTPSSSCNSRVFPSRKILATTVIVIVLATTISNTCCFRQQRKYRQLKNQVPSPVSTSTYAPAAAAVTAASLAFSTTSHTASTGNTSSVTETVTLTTTAATTTVAATTKVESNTSWSTISNGTTTIKPLYTVTSGQRVTPKKENSKLAHAKKQPKKKKQEQQQQEHQLKNKANVLKSSSHEKEFKLAKQEDADGEGNLKVSNRADESIVASHYSTTRPFYNIAHMVNSIKEINYYLSRGANAIEADVAFSPNGSALYTFHGYPCDCFRHCTEREDITKYLEYVREITRPGKSTEASTLFLHLTCHLHLNCTFSLSLFFFLTSF